MDEWKDGWMGWMWLMDEWVNEAGVGWMDEWTKCINI